MKTSLVFLGLTLCGCGPFHYRTSMPRPPVCVRGGIEPFAQSMNDYGSSYTAGMDGPAPAAPDTYLIPEREAGAICVAPPWWRP